MDYRILKTYDKAWHFDRKLYAIDRYTLPFPIDPDEVVYLAVGILFVFLLGNVFPAFDQVPPLLKYAGIPWLLMKFLTKKKFDGKLAHRYLVGYIDYFGLPRVMVRFTAVGLARAGMFDTVVVFRTPETIDKTDMVIKERRWRK